MRELGGWGEAAEEQGVEGWGAGGSEGVSGKVFEAERSDWRGGGDGGKDVAQRIPAINRAINQYFIDAAAELANVLSQALR